MSDTDVSLLTAGIYSMNGGAPVRVLSWGLDS